MFYLKYVPAWFPAMLTLAGILGYYLLDARVNFVYTKFLKILSAISIALGIFILGMLYTNNWWVDKARDLEAKVVAAEASAKVVNTEIKEKVVVKREYYRVRGQDIVQYVDREVVKYDNECKIPQEFIEAHNRAAKP